MHTYERIKYYSTEDLSLPLQAHRIDELKESSNEWIGFTDINDVIELYEMQKIIINGKGIDAKYKKLLPLINKVLGVYFSKIGETNLLDKLANTSNLYRGSFWELIAKYKVYEHISGDCFKRLTKEPAFSINHILSVKKLVTRYENEIREYLIGNIGCARFLIREFLEEVDYQKERYYFPQGLTISDRQNIIIKYIGDEEATIRERELISKTCGNEQLPITPEIKLAAKRQNEKRIRKLTQNGVSITYGAVISFKKMPNGQIRNQVFKKGIIEAEYDIDWIRNEQDYATLLNNFIWLFGYVDHQSRWSHVSNEAAIGNIEKVFQVKGKREYPTGGVFYCINHFADAQLRGYYNVLRGLGIEIEEIISWFFKVYLPNELNTYGFIFNKPTNNMSYLEKCRNLVIEIDSLLKQFSLFSKTKEIDQELFEISTEHMLVSSVPSMLPDKYLYPTGDDFKKASHILCSNQSIAYYIKGKTDNCESLLDALDKTIINYKDLQHYQLPSINWLISKGLLATDTEGNLIYDKKLLWLIKDLYYNGCICTVYIKGFKRQIDWLKDNGMLRPGSTFLSEPEQHYFNYIFNHSEYDNSLDLRNRYAHGTRLPNAEENEKDFYVILRMLILIIIKLNEELCLHEELYEEKGIE